MRKNRYVMCRILLYIFLLVISFKLIIGVIDIVCILSTPASEIHVTDTGYSWRFDGILGYNQYTYIGRGISGVIDNPKVFCVTYIILMTAVMEIPYLVLLYFIRKMLLRAESEYSPFVQEMVRYTNIVAGILIGIGLLSKNILVLGMSIVSNNTNLDLTDEIQYEWLFAGIMVLLFRDMFARGCALQKESDETL